MKTKITQAEYDKKLEKIYSGNQTRFKSATEICDYLDTQYEVVE